MDRSSKSTAWVQVHMNVDITCDCYATRRKYLETCFRRFQPIRDTRMQFWLIAVITYKNNINVEIYTGYLLKFVTSVYGNTERHFIY